MEMFQLLQLLWENFVAALLLVGDVFMVGVWYSPNLISDPFNTIFTMAIYSFLTAIWTLAAFPIAVIRWLQPRLAPALGRVPALWPDPRFFERMPPGRISDAKSILAAPNTTLDFDNVSSRPVGRFSVDLAEFMLQMSNAMYFRENVSSEDEALVYIRELAKGWGMHFEHVAQLATAEDPFRGPYCGTFEPVDSDSSTAFLVVALKGTTPFDYGEWTGEFRIAKTVAPFLDGLVHKGIYERLFPETVGKRSGYHPYGAIVQRLRDKIKAHWEKYRTPLPIWFTGHSLGAALATLLIARFLKSPRDLGDRGTYQLMDCYNFGCPPTGDAHCVIAIESNLIKPIDRYSVIWRVINDGDVATRLPFDYENINILARSDPDTIHNFAHVGVGIRLYRNGSRPTVHPQFYSTGTKVEMYAFDGENKATMPLRSYRSNILQEIFYRIRYFFPVALLGDYNHSTPTIAENGLASWLGIWIGRLVIPMYIADHFPSRYYESLEMARKSTLNNGDVSQRS